MTFDPMSVEVTCVTLPKDHCVQVPWEYINVCGYSDQFCKLPHTYIHIHTYILRTYYVQNERSHSLLLNSVQARQKWERVIFTFQLERHFLRYSCAQFSVCVFTQIYHHVTKELCAWLITRYTFRAHWCVIYQRTITQDADVFWEDKNFIKFPSKIVRFWHFFMKSNTSTPFFLFRYDRL